MIKAFGYAFVTTLATVILFAIFGFIAYVAFQLWGILGAFAVLIGLTFVSRFIEGYRKNEN